MLKRLVCLAMLASAPVLAQGQDSSVPEREVQVLGVLLPGDYDNWNQTYFAQRGNLPQDERHERVHSAWRAVDLPNFGGAAFFELAYRNGDATKPFRKRIHVLSADNEAKAVRMKSYHFDDPKWAKLNGALDDPAVLAALRPGDGWHQDGCDILWRRGNNAFIGAMEKGKCAWDWPNRGPVTSEVEMQISPAAYWFRDLTFNDKGEQITGHKTQTPHKLDRARLFTCYVDIPGVGGGRAEPFVRYENLKIHDGGGQVFFKTKDGKRELGLTLSHVRWAINNETGAFTRDSLVLYINEKIGEKVETLTYSFTDPAADRLGINMKSLLANCYLVSNRDAKPTFQ